MTFLLRLFLLAVLQTHQSGLALSFTFLPQDSRRFGHVATPKKSISNRMSICENEDIDVPSKSKFLRRYLGQGPDAIVREGCVLVAPVHEYHHLLMRSVLFVYAIGHSDELDETVARAVIIDHPTAFTVGEMVDLSSYVNEEEPGIQDNRMFRGGDMGKDIVMLLHSYDGDYPDKKDMIGTSGIYEGGLASVMEAAVEGDIPHPEKEVKFFFNYYEFTKSQLDHMFDEGKNEDADDKEIDSWISLEVDASIILNGDLDKGEAWTTLRNAVKQLEMAK